MSSVELLLAHGADVRVQKDNGRTPLEQALRAENNEVWRRFLLARRVGTGRRDGCSFLFGSCCAFLWQVAARLRLEVEKVEMPISINLPPAFTHLEA